VRASFFIDVFASGVPAANGVSEDIPRSKKVVEQAIDRGKTITVVPV